MAKPPSAQFLGPSVFLAAVAAALLSAYALNPRLTPSLAITFLHRQDLPLALAASLLLALCALRPRPAPDPRGLTLGPVLWLGILAALAAWAGHHLVLMGHDLSRDEQMANFDAMIFASGRLVAPLPAGWVGHEDALNTLFMLPVADRIAWVSGYLPMNAAIRALLFPLGMQAVVGPLAVLAGAVALWGCARHLWPQDLSCATLALLLYLGSGQVLVNGMTSYAMPLHLAANLIWLWLFLQDRRSADLAALGIAFIAVGLHQPVFHPMFAFPVLLGLVVRRDWPRAALFLGGYALIGAFWFAWPTHSAALTGTPLPGGDAGYIKRLTDELLHGQSGGLPEMIANILRFFTWQHLLLLPLLRLGLTGPARRAPMAGLAGGLALTLGVMAVILPYQGHGFGYRYLHGLIGNAILLAVAGWHALGPERAAWNGLVRRASVAGLVVVLPLQLVLAHAFYAPFASAARLIDRSAATYLLVDPAAAPFAGDLVINTPDLTNRPVRLLADRVDAALLAQLCRDGATVDRLPDAAYAPIRQYFGQPAPAENIAQARPDAGGCPPP